MGKNSYYYYEVKRVGEKLCCLSGEELTILGVLIANALAEQYDADDLNILSSLMSLIGDSLGVIAAHRAACTPSTEEDSESHSEKGGETVPDIRE